MSYYWSLKVLGCASKLKLIGFILLWGLVDKNYFITFAELHKNYIRTQRKRLTLGWEAGLDPSWPSWRHLLTLSLWEAIWSLLRDSFMNEVSFRVNSFCLVHTYKKYWVNLTRWSYLPVEWAQLVVSFLICYCSGCCDCCWFQNWPQGVVDT